MLILPEKIKFKMIAILTNEKKVKQALLFGSRARGDFRPNSDIDIVLVGHDIPLSLNTKLREAAGLYTLDIVRLDELENDSLKANINREGKLLYSIEETSTLV